MTQGSHRLPSKVICNVEPDSESKYTKQKTSRDKLATPTKKQVGRVEKSEKMGLETRAQGTQEQ